MLHNHLKRLSLFLLPNHWNWNRLKKEEKEEVLSACYMQNNLRYICPQEYDQAHSRVIPAIDTKEGRIIQNILNKYSPVSVLEVGPGSGFFIKLLLDHHSVLEYSAIDIVLPFLDHIKTTILTETPPHKKIDLICGDLLTHDFKRKFDLILFNSTLHHIPNRADFINKCSGLLTRGGGIVIIEPKHGIPRILQLCKKYMLYYHKDEFWKDKLNLPTHHFLTYSEVKSIARSSQLDITDLFFYRFRGEKYLKFLTKPKYGFFYCSHFAPLSLFAHYVCARLERRVYEDS